MTFIPTADNCKHFTNTKIGMKNVVYKHTTTCMKTQYDPIPRLRDS